MEALEIFPKVESASFNREQLTEEGIFSTEIELELLKFEAFTLLGLLETLSSLSSLRRRAREEFTSFVELFFKLGLTSERKGMPDEDLLACSFFCINWRFKLQSQLTLHFSMSIREDLS